MFVITYKMFTTVRFVRKFENGRVSISKNAKLAKKFKTESEATSEAFQIAKSRFGNALIKVETAL